MRPSASTSEMAVVVLPSPNFVGVIAVTEIELPVGRAGEAVERRELDLRRVAAVGLDLVGVEVEGGRELGDGESGCGVHG